MKYIKTPQTFERDYLSNLKYKVGDIVYMIEGFVISGGAVKSDVLYKIKKIKNYLFPYFIQEIDSNFKPLEGRDSRIYQVQEQQILRKVEDWEIEAIKYNI